MAAARTAAAIRTSAKKPWLIFYSDVRVGAIGRRTVTRPAESVTGRAGGSVRRCPKLN
jgi:hypothetical protein